MNTTHDDTPASAGPDLGLPELSDERIERIESRVFAGIAHDRVAARTRRRRWWIGGSAAAAVIIVAAVIAPSVGSLVSGTVGSAGSTTDEAGSAPLAPDVAGGSDLTQESARDSGQLDGASLPLADQAAAPDRAIITTASATVVVEDVSGAAGEIAASAEAHGGYVESMSIGQSGQVYPVDPNGVVYDSTYPYPYPSPDGAWITVRVPADELSTMVDELSGLGEVTASTVSRQDVTEQTIDLQARIDAAQASVDRLIELMAQAGDLSDLIAAEAALSERQATLESYQQQLESLEGQVDMATLSVTLVPESEPVEADPAGFTDGLVAGWNGLVATLNGIVVAVGFLLPWLAVAAVLALAVWGIARAVKRRRTQRRAARAAERAAEAAEASKPAE
ncbi:DUF4349 domain-containing protein [Microbacterium sp. SS28]|uniref:DUF4349 domain-containing protein n=1 Tax=Microbacterium sp. SS28 TaxID=2919948 RepID=UPI001FAB0506|nr:DUF4349 domain-containing protein [Microbacterium sp. SS28]